jgi:hypothetical protein
MWKYPIVILLLLVNCLAQSTIGGNGTLGGNGAGSITQAPGLVINTTTLLSGIFGIPYSATLAASGGNPPYTWSVFTGTLPTGLTLNSVTGVISGTPTAVVTQSFTVKVLDSSSPQLNATQPLTLIIAAANCGPPTYPCARTDRTVTFSATQLTNMCPPQAGVATCTPGTNGQSLVNTGWLFGRNTIMTDPNYNNIQMVRLVDYSDTQQPYNCPGPSAGPGGSAEENIWSSDKQYILIGCNNGGARLIHFNPTTLQIAVVNALTTSPVASPGSATVTTNNTTYMQVNVPQSVDTGTSQEYVTPTAVVAGVSFTAVFANTHLSGAKVSSQGYVAGWTGTNCTYCMPASGEFDYTTPDVFYLLNGYQVLSYTITGALASSSTLVADLSQAVPCWQSACPDWSGGGTWAAGTVLVPLTNNPAGDVFQLMNTTTLPCTKGATYPNFASTTLTIIADGGCNWLNSGPKNNAGHVYPGLVSHNGHQWAAGLANAGGDGGIGSMHVTLYDSTTLNYYYHNSATGSVFVNTCSGGTGPSCTGGTFSTPVFQSYIIPSGQDLTLLHNTKIWKGGNGITVGPQKCAFATVQCSTPGGGNIYFWNTTTNTQYWPNVSPGHHCSGYNYLMAESGYTSSNPYQYSFGIPFASGGTLQKYFKANQTPPALCSPLLCPTNPPFDQHTSCVAENTSDTAPVCGAALSNSYGNWPYNYPYFGEVYCYATDGSNNVWRQGLSYNSNANVGFNTWANVGGLSSDGSLWANSTDWFNTLGSNTGLTTCLGGFNWQPSHTYNLNDKIAPGTNNSPAAGASVFQATSCQGGVCTSGTMHPVWTTGTGSSPAKVDGTITWTNQGTNNCNATIVVYRLN